MKKSILILIGIFSVLSIVVFAQLGDNTGVSVTILEEPTIFLGDNEFGDDTIDNDGEIWATLTTDSQVKKCEINWDGIWQAIDKTITSIKHVYDSDGEKTVYYRCYDDNNNAVSVDDSILIQLIIACSINADCGTDTYVGNSFCQNGNVWQNYRTYKCNNPGTYDSYCSNSTAPKLKEECPGGCTEGRCKVKVCKTICNYGKCYEYCEWR